MRANPVKQRLLAGGHSFGSFVSEFFTPGLPQILCNAGAEFLIFDMEHSGLGLDGLKKMCAYTRGLPLVPLVRPPNDDPHFLAHALDVGAMGVEVPMVETAAQARRIVHAVRYPPLGGRGVAFGGTAHEDYQSGDLSTLMREENARTLVICLIESPAGIDNIDAIAAVDGVDVLWLGQVDLTCTMGIPGRYDDPRFLQAVDRFLQACERHGKVPGMTPLNEAWARDWMGRGFRMVAWSSDARMLRTAMQQGIELLGKLAT